MPPDPTSPPLAGRKREALANDRNVLVAAREVFSLHGPEATIGQVAERAGVGVGSIYRRYSTKSALVRALHVAAIDDLAQIARECAEGAKDTEGTAATGQGAPSGAVETFLRRHILESFGPLIISSGEHPPATPEVDAASAALHEALERVLATDREAGLVPSTFTPADLMLLITHLRPPLPLPREQADALHLRYLGVALSGLAQAASTVASAASAPASPAGATTSTALPPGPSWEDWLAMWTSRDPGVAADG
ncbi:TetR/AcrR family transcriptional regulator [Oerskovia sp. NPDC057915]|uniref:TetR/AcrR family transcriptional regulator n=1 Tax=Oerskovia sp. NPDC057915 TaxID=3346280 RepID=UPI0036D8AD9D